MSDHPSKIHHRRPQPIDESDIIGLIATYTRAGQAILAEDRLAALSVDTDVTVLDGALIAWTASTAHPTWRSLRGVARHAALPDDAWDAWLDPTKSLPATARDRGRDFQNLAALIQPGHCAIVICAPGRDRSTLTTELAHGAHAVTTTDVDPLHYAQLRRPAPS